MQRECFAGHMVLGLRLGTSQFRILLGDVSSLMMWATNWLGRW